MPTVYATNNGQGKRDAKRANRTRIVQPSTRYDSFRNAITDFPSPDKFVALLRRVDSGELNVLCQLQMEMEAKSAQFQGICETRRNALTGLDWCIEPDQDLVDDSFAHEVADYCTETLTAIRSWPSVLQHLAEAIGPNVCVVENIWEAGEIVDFACVPYTRLTSHPLTNVGVAVMTDDEPMGIPADAIPMKFVVFHRHWNGGFPFRRTLTHASVLPYLFINLSQKDWLAFSELYGQPVRHGTAPQAANEEVRDVLTDLLDNMGSDSAAMFPTGTEIGYLQATGTGETYQKQLDYADAKLSILWLGQTLTTDIGSTGSYAAAKVHDNVRTDLLKSDIMAEAMCIREQLLRPMVELKFPGRDAPVPYFVRNIDKGRDVEGERLDLDKIEKAKSLGMTVQTDWLYETMGIPKPETDLPDTIKLGGSTQGVDGQNPNEPPNA